MTCREVAEVLLEFESGELPREHRARALQHMDDCPSCVAFVESYRLTIQISRRLPRPILPEQLQHSLQAMLIELQGEQATGKSD